MHSIYTVQLGQNIRAMRKLRGMTVAKLAEEIGATDDSIRKYERGDRDPGIEIVVKCAIALNCSVYTLIDGIDPRNRTEDSGKELRMLSPQSNRVMRWVASEWAGDTDALITAFGYYAAVPGEYRRHAMMELIRRKEEAIEAGAMTEEDVPQCVRDGLEHLEMSLGGLYE